MTEDGIIFLNEVDSTNNYLKQLAEGDNSLQEGLMVCAEYQSTGRGYSTNKWESNKGENLTFSTLFYPTFVEPSEMFLISQVVSLGVVDFLSEYVNKAYLSIKWPNDIYWKDKKIAGILIENLISEHNIENSIVGIGININQEEFLSDAPNPISLFQITGKKLPVDETAIKVKQALFARYFTLLKSEKESLRNDYFSILYRRDGFYKYSDKNGIFNGKIIDIEDNGTLSLQRENGEISKYQFKEVEFIL